jgi:hypothetical protein
VASSNRLPKDIEQRAKERFSKIANPETTFEVFLEIEKQENQRQAQLERDPSLRYQPGLPSMTPCGNGDFDITLDPAEWQGAHGKVPLNASQPFAIFTPGLFPGAINATDSSGAGTAHQTWVANASGADPLVGIPLTAQGSPGAVRIGNAVNLYGCELLSKTFVVTAAKSLIKFWYAVVLQNPEGHPPAEQPFFWVRVTDTASDTVIPGAVNLGNGSDKLVADKTNPFFKTQIGTPPGYVPEDLNTTIVYKDWTCAQINLSSHIGKKVTIEFVTADCGYGGHWGYAYVDNFCGTCAGSPEGTITFDAETSSNCGEGKLCFDYTLPKVTTTAGGTQTGSITITLDIYQNGILLTKMSSPTLTSGSKHCFNVKPSSIPAIDTSLGGFDFVATGAFTIGSTILAPMTVGAAPDGRVPGPNNDYQIQCTFFSYAVKFVCGVEPECACSCAPVRPGSYATEINIYNHNAKRAVVRKHVVPVVLAGAPAGREPHVASRRAEDRIVLPPYSATMDDCCRITELLLGAPAQGPMPLTIGFLEIVSPVELSVTAVYTASGPNGKGVSIDVQQIEAKMVRV